jgi:hypothetical protein
MREFFIKLMMYSNIIADNNNKPNQNLIQSYFNNDGTRKSNNLRNLKYFFIIPILIYLFVVLMFSIIYLIVKRKLVISFWFIDHYFNYLVEEYNNKYLY